MGKESYPETGSLDQRLAVLELVAEGPAMSWQVCRRTWGSVQTNTTRTVYSVHGIGASGVTITMRRQRLGQENALLWHGKHILITNVEPVGLLHMKITGALVVICRCEDKYADPVRSFPAVMTEKYRKHDQLEPHAINTLTHVLVTPKGLGLIPGRLVEVDGESWHILVAHTLDPYKDEYELEKVIDL